MYKKRSRWLYMVACGFVLTLVFRYGVFGGMNQHAFWLDLLATIITTIVIWEGNLQLDHYLDQKYTWQGNTRKRVLIQLLSVSVFNLLVLVSIINGYHNYLCYNNPVADKLVKGAFFISLFVSFMILAIELSIQFFRNWKASLIEVEKYKTESTRAQLESLKNQINPHFLFNNLSVLTSLVQIDQNKAVEFIQEMSKTYRYVLDNRNTELVTLENELQFLDHYIFLLKIRFGENIIFSTHIQDDCKTLMLPPLCLQMLVENAIKHNEVSKANPLNISIYAIDKHITVSNPILKRGSDESTTKSGLRNIESRYSFFTEEKISVVHNEKTFTISLPLLPAS